MLPRYFKAKIVCAHISLFFALLLCGSQFDNSMYWMLVFIVYFIIVVLYLVQFKCPTCNVKIYGIDEDEKPNTIRTLNIPVECTKCGHRY
jgi:hypothetical protein